MSLLIALICALGMRAPLSEGYAKGQTKRAGKSAPVVAEAERAWGPFFENFSSIVKRRDRQGLYDAMAGDFSFGCAYNGGYGYQGEGVGRDFEIKKFDGNAEPAYDCGGWARLAEMIAARRVTRILKKDEIIGGLGGVKRTPSRIISNYGSRGGTRICDVRGGGNWALFEYRQGRWYFVELSFCETE